MCDMTPVEGESHYWNYKLLIEGQQFTVAEKRIDMKSEEISLILRQTDGTLYYGAEISKREFDEAKLGDIVYYAPLEAIISSARYTLNISVSLGHISSRYNAFVKRLPLAADEQVKRQKLVDEWDKLRAKFLKDLDDMEAAKKVSKERVDKEAKKEQILNWTLVGVAVGQSF